MQIYTEAITRPPHDVEIQMRHTPAEWLSMLPAVVAQLPLEQHEAFLLQVLRALDYAGLELAGCVADEFGVAEKW